MTNVTREEMQKWETLTNIFQFSSIALLFVGAIGLGQVSKETAHVLVWYWAAITFAVATISFLVGRKSAKLTSDYFKGSLNTLKGKLKI